MPTTNGTTAASRAGIKRRSTAGFKAWLKLGYCVGKGEKAIRIVAPMPIWQRESAQRDEETETRVLFKGVSVFDRSPVSALACGAPTPLEPPCGPLTGDSHGHLLRPLVAFAETLGYCVSFEDIAGPAGGWCDAKAKRIVVNSGAPANARLRTLIHETIHALGVGYAEYGRERAELIVDTVVFSPGWLEWPMLSGCTWVSAVTDVLRDAPFGAAVRDERTGVLLRCRLTPLS